MFNTTHNCSKLVIQNDDITDSIASITGKGRGKGSARFHEIDTQIQFSREGSDANVSVLQEYSSFSDLGSYLHTWPQTVTSNEVYLGVIIIETGRA